MKLGINQVSIIEGYRNDYGLQFDGVASYGESAISGLPTTAGSLSAWIRIDSTLVTANTYAFITGSSGNTWLNFGKGGTSDRIAVRGAFSGTNANAFYSLSYVVGEWVHLLATFDGTDFKAYHNGVLYSTQNRAGQTLTTTGSFLWFGRSNIYTPVTIDEVSIWDRAISVSEVASSNKPIDLYGASGLLRWYRMGDFYQSSSSTIVNSVDGSANISLYNISQSTDFVAGVV